MFSSNLYKDLFFVVKSIIINHKMKFISPSYIHKKNCQKRKGISVNNFLNYNKIIKRVIENK